MKLRLIKASNQYKSQIIDMLDEWNASGEKIIPYAIRRIDYHDFEYYCDHLEVKDAGGSLVPDSTYFCLDEERNMIVGAVNIRHYLNELLLLNGGHIGDGVRPSERRKGIAAFRILSFGEITHLDEHDEEPSFAARFCECYEDESRHD